MVQGQPVRISGTPRPHCEWKAMKSIRLHWERDRISEENWELETFMHKEFPEFYEDNMIDLNSGMNSSLV